MALLMSCLADCPSLEPGAVVSVNDGGVEMSKALDSPMSKSTSSSYTGSTGTGKAIMAAASGT